MTPSALVSTAPTPVVETAADTRTGQRAFSAVVVCDAPARRAELVAWLTAAGYLVDTEATGAEALRRVRADDSDLLILGEVHDLSEGEASHLLGAGPGASPALVAVGADTGAEDLVALASHAARARVLERDLEAAKRSFRSMVQASGAPLALVTGDLTYLAWNPHWSTDVAAGEWRPGLSLLDHTADADANPLRAAAAEAMASAGPVGLARATRWADGSTTMTRTILNSLPGTDPPQLLVEVTLETGAGGELPLRSMIATAPIAACALDSAGRCTAVNGALLNIVDLSESEVIGRPFVELVGSAERRRFATARILDEPTHQNVPLLGRNREPVHTMVHTAPFGSPDGPDRVLVLVTEAALSAPVAVEHLTRSYALTAIIRRLQHRDVELVIPDVVRVLAAAVHASDAGILRHEPSGATMPLPDAVVGRASALAPDPARADGRAEEQHPSRLELPLSWTGDGRCTLAVSRTGGTDFTPPEVRFLTDVAAAMSTAVRREHSARSELRASTHDRLTDLPNRQYVVAELDGLLRRSRGRHFPAAAMAIDVDHFHAVNHGLSYASGDELLRLIADRLRTVMPGSDLVARSAGDEFVVAARDPESLEDAEAIAEEIAAVLAQPFYIEGTELRITVSIGLALSAEGMESGEDLLKNAALAMATAKGEGGARYVVFSDDMYSAAAAHLELVRDLRRGLDAGEFEPWFQPLVELGSGEVVGVEALARWRHPTRGLLMPDEFIGVAEDTGLIVRLGQTILEQACAQVMIWRRDPECGATALRFAVNASAPQLARPDFVEKVASALASSGADSRFLTVEITESVLMDDPAASTRTLRRLKDLGVSVSIDDFGTGYSSLAYLRQFPIDELKVDRSFVAGMGEGGAPEIATAVVGLAQSLRLGIVAEGIESVDQLDALHALGVRIGQGYLWSRPLPPDEFAAWLRRTRQEGLTRAKGPTTQAAEHAVAPSRRPEIDRVVLSAVREILRAEEPTAATAALSRMVGQLGGYTMPAHLAHGNGLPFDLALGEGEPIVAVAETGSVTAMLLADILPEVLDDATLAIANAREAVRLASDAALDPLTGLLNRRGLSRAYARLREGDSIALIDIDHFKDINDSFGHPMGDEVLTAFGRMLRHEARSADYVGRMGGDEFVMVLLRSAPDRTVALLSRLREAWSSYRPLPVTFTAGVGQVGPDGSVDAALHRADLGLYQVKQTGRDAVGVWDPDHPADNGE